MKIKLRKIYYYGGVISFIAICIAFAYFFIFNPLGNRLSQMYLKESYEGRVTNKYIDKKNHSYRVVILDNSERVTIPGGSYDLFDKIDIGDSLTKKKSEMVGYLIKENSIINIDYNKSIPIDR